MNAIVVISHLNSARTLDRCLTALDEQDYPCRVVVIDGGSTDDSIEIAKRHKVSLKVVPGCTEAEGQTIAIDENPSDVICLTNSDCYVPKDWVRRHVEWQERGFQMVGGKLFWGGDDYGFSWSFPTPSGPSDLLTSGLSLGWSNCSISRELYDKLGIKDMKSQQDMDFWIRAIKDGLKFVMDPKIEVYHDHPMKSFKGSFMRSFYYGRNHVLLLREGFGRSKWPHYDSYAYAIRVAGEIPMISGTRVWKQQRDKAAQYGIHISLIRFLFLRVLGCKVPNWLGWVSGMASPLHNSEVGTSALMNAHPYGKET